MQTRQISFKTPHIRIGCIVIGAVLLLFTWLLGTQPAKASPTDPLTVSLQNEACLLCHGKPDSQRSMPSGEVLSLSIDQTLFHNSVHGTLNCTDCHTNILSFPHPTSTAQTVRDVALELYVVCQTCHVEQYNQAQDSIHQKALSTGNTNAAICTDCHNPHSQPPIGGTESNLNIRVEAAQKCARCHNAIYGQYQQSVHGAALLEESNSDVPACTDCHGVHKISDPTTNTFRLSSPQLCANCHTDAAIMEKYGLSTNVLNTYVADFHGTTVTLFQAQSPDQPSNKPVCYDCHGIHDIKRVNDPVHGLEMKQNLLTKCQQCHPEAGPNFPDSWMSHYIPSAEHYPVVYYVNLFYKFFIPGVLGPMAIFVISDIVRRLIERYKGARHA